MRTSNTSRIVNWATKVAFPNTLRLNTGVHCDANTTKELLKSNLYASSYELLENWCLDSSSMEMVLSAIKHSSKHFRSPVYCDYASLKDDCGIELEEIRDLLRSKGFKCSYHSLKDVEIQLNFRFSEDKEFVSLQAKVKIILEQDVITSKIDSSATGIYSRMGIQLQRKFIEIEERYKSL